MSEEVGDEIVVPEVPEQAPYPGAPASKEELLAATREMFSKKPEPEPEQVEEPEVIEEVIENEPTKIEPKEESNVEEPKSLNLDEDFKPQEKPKKPTKSENIKNLRQTNSRLKSELEAERARVLELQERTQTLDELSNYEEQIGELKTRIEQLEPLETIHALSENPVFRAKFIEGEQKVIDNGLVIERDYGLPEGLLAATLQLDSVKARNDLLKQHCDDEDARADLKRVIKSVLDLRKEKDKALAAPQETLKEVREAEKLAKAQVAEQHKVAAQNTVSTAWKKALDMNKSSESWSRYFNEVAGEKEHNTRVANQLGQAQGITDKLITHVLENGEGSASSPEFASYISLMAQKSLAADQAVSDLAAANEKIQKLEAKLERQTGYSRPSVGKAPTRSKPTTEKKPIDGKEASAIIAQTVLERFQE